MVSNGSVSAPLVANKSGITLGVCSVDRRNVQGLIFSITALQDIGVDVVFKECPLTVRGLMAMDLNDIDVILLCHSLHLSHLALTDVQGSLYDEFLPKCRRVLGKHRVGILVHDLSGDDLLHDRLAAHKRGFMSTQTTAVECSSLVLFGGNMASNPPELTRDQMEQMERFFRGERDIKKSGMCLPCLCCGLGGKTEYALVHSESTEVPRSR